MMNKQQKFVVNVGGDQRREVEFRYLINDPIFSMSEPLEDFDRPENQNPNCNCCDEKYKGPKDVKYW